MIDVHALFLVLRVHIIDQHGGRGLQEDAAEETSWKWGNGGRGGRRKGSSDFIAGEHI